MRSGAKLNVAPEGAARHAQARRVAVRSASTEPAAAPRKVADSDMINLGKTGELSGRQHRDSVAWDILLCAHCFRTVAVAFACASPCAHCMSRPQPGACLPLPKKGRLLPRIPRTHC